MSMNRFANAGPIMAGLAAMSDDWAPEGAKSIAPLDTTISDETKAALKAIDAATVRAPMFAPSAADLVRMIENVADQVSEIAAQMVDIRRRQDEQAGTLGRLVAHMVALEGQTRQPPGSPYAGMSVGTAGAFAANNSKVLQAQQSARSAFASGNIAQAFQSYAGLAPIKRG